MKPVPILSIAICLLSLPAYALQSKNPGGIGCTNGFNLPGGEMVFVGTGTVKVADWHVLTDNDAIIKALNEGREAVDRKCALDPTPVVSIDVIDKASGWGMTVISAWWYRPDGQWRIRRNEVSNLAAIEKQKIAIQEQQAAAAKRAQLAAEEKERRKQAALADCGTTPTISGGPWFSSTYKVAAGDATRNPQFLCVKSVEYISAAPNPYGGNAARAKFSGYEPFDYQPVVKLFDFAY